MSFDKPDHDNRGIKSVFPDRTYFINGWKMDDSRVVMILSIVETKVINRCVLRGKPGKVEYWLNELVERLERHKICQPELMAIPTMEIRRETVLDTDIKVESVKNVSYQGQKSSLE